MPVSVAEYFGQRSDIDVPKIEPVVYNPPPNCPFMMDICDKAKNNKKPVCSVRKKKNGKLWISCRHRLCSTRKTVTLSSYQISILQSIANTVYNEQIKLNEILIRREQAMRVTSRSSYKADYIMIRKSETGIDPIKIVLEMQGGGETSNTGILSKHVETWESDPDRTNSLLKQYISKVGTIETNAWRRQQEQFLVKGNIAHQTGGRIVFCMGDQLYDYVIEKVNACELRDLRLHNWTLALICIDEDNSTAPAFGPIPLQINKEKMIFTNYNSFVIQLTNQGDPDPEIFRGQFISLDGRKEIIK